MTVVAPANDDAEWDAIATELTTATPEEADLFLRALDAGQVSKIEAAMARMYAVGWRSDPATMAAHLTKNTADPFIPYAYSVLLSRKFVDAVEGRSMFQIWNLPPQYGKSYLCQWGVTWALDRDPSNNFILVSYGDELAGKNALAVRDNLQEYDLNAQLRPDVKRRDRFSTPQGGGVLARGIRSGITGFSANGIVVDDPFKNWVEAHSAHTRQQIEDMFWAQVFNRRTKGGQAWVIIVMTRWHEDDLVARLLAKRDAGDGLPWELVRIPEIAEEPKPDSLDPILRDPDPLGRAPGELLEPRMYDAAAVKIKQATSAYLWAGMHQQRPAPAEGTELLREWFKFGDPPTAPDQSLTSWDFKLKDNESGDFVVGQLWWRVGGHYWLMDQIRGKFDHGTTANAVALMAVRHPECVQHVIEAAGSADEVVPALAKAIPDYVVTEDMAGRLGMNDDERAAVEKLRRRGMSGLTPHPVKHDKSVRVRLYATPAAQAGNVHIPDGAPYADVFLDECATFPSGLHDDMTDCFSMAMQRFLAGREVPLVAPGGSTQQSHWRR